MEDSRSFQGDLTDIIRAAAAPPEPWQFPATNPVDIYPNELGRDDFGDPFRHFPDPLIHDGETPAESGFFHSRPGLDESRSTVGFASNAGGENNNNSNNNMGQMINLEDEMKGPNYFSRMLQISPASAKLPPALSDSPPADLNLIISRNCLVENPAGLQISSPRNTGIRRRKSQVKKVVCIPAPTPANSRATGEIVPSDLWAWRKYGQKPIKGSPYPRGYYRCSSSKGCSARKQVERSRADPNTLVITYASEHNHPWPTQRNALAGSTRSQPSKTNGPKIQAISQAPQTPIRQKEEERETTVPENTTPSTSAADEIIQSVKDEAERGLDPNPDMREMDGPDLDDGFPSSYDATLPGANQAEDSFFADLGEIEADSKDIFGFPGGGGSGHEGLDPFTFCDWDGSDSTGPASPGGAATPDPSGCTSSYGGADKD